MNKKFGAVLILIFISLSCNRSKFTQFKVYPDPENLTVVMGGESFIPIKIEIPGKHHIYGNPKGPGIGKPTEVFVVAPDELQFKEARYLPPKKFYFPGEKEHTFGYEDHTTIFLPFSVKNNIKRGSRTVHIAYEALLCNDTVSGNLDSIASACIPKTGNFDFSITIIPRGETGTTVDAATVNEFKRSFPPKNGTTTENKELILGPANTASSPREAEFNTYDFSPRFIERGVSGIFQAILFGIIAGFILNFMPCVLPVVSLKVLSFVQQADKNRRELFKMGMLFFLGIMTSFTIIASLSAFFGYKWGGLFQHRLFIIVMAGIVYALALSLLGVFVINPPSFAGKAAKKKSNQYLDAFSKGLLTTLLATPCSGPFLGGTLSWALSQPPAVIFTVFLSIGFGMAVPYLVLTLNPALLRFIPKPGAWTKIFEQVMAFILVFTVIYLISILDEASLKPMIVFIGVLSIGFWQFGVYGAIYQKRLLRLSSLLLLVGLIAGGYFFSFHYFFIERENEKIIGNNLTLERLLENKEKGRISMVKFTAEWCPNCKLVEKMTLENPAILETIRNNNIDFIVADITRKNPPAEKLLSLMHSNSIPILAVIPPGRGFGKPIILRDIYTKRDVIEAVRIAASDMENRKSSGAEYKVDLSDSIIKKN